MNLASTQSEENSSEILSPLTLHKFFALIKYDLWSMSKAALHSSWLFCGALTTQEELRPGSLMFLSKYHLERIMSKFSMFE